MGLPRYYKKPKPETIQKRKEEYAEKYNKVFKKKRKKPNKKN